MNQYTQVGDTSYFFDADGNLVREVSPAGTTTYTYNDENRLISVTSPDGTWQYAYDGQGNRVSTTENGITTYYMIDPVGLGDVVGEYDAVGDILARYNYGLGLVAGIIGPSTAYYTYDALGSTSDVTTEEGSIANIYRYDPFGISLTRSENLVNPFQYIGQLGVMEEGAGNQNMRAREYDRELGRFVQQDPIRINGGINLYSYANNSVIDSVDPSGLVIWSQVALGTFEVIGAGLFFAGIVSGTVAASPLAMMGVGVLAFYAAYAGAVGVAQIAGGVTDVEISLNNGFVGDMARIVGLDESAVIVGDIVDLLPKLLSSLNSEASLTFRYLYELAGAIKDIYDSWSAIFEGWGSAISAASDPNSLTGPAGYGPTAYISCETTVPYRIDFENESSATAPAQQVFITDQLDSDLDWGSFELTEIAFGDILINVPADSGHFETTVPMTYNNQTFDVQIEAGINYSTGVVTALFQSLNPETGLPPDVLTGFLPPEDGTGRGMGSISYTIDPKEGVTTGTEIKNIALISFDSQPAIATNQVDPHDPSKGTAPAKECLNTIDSGDPTSSVSPLADNSETVSFLVEWSGSDDTNGSGVASYDIYVSRDSGAYTLWLNDSADLSATYTGLRGHTYSFYSIARDNVGNVETAPGEPDAQIYVIENYAPEMEAVPDRIVDEGSVLTFAVIASDPNPSDFLSFTLENALDGATIDHETGIFTWIPPDGPLEIDVTVKVTDHDASFPLFDSETFTVTVNNIAPALTISGEDKAYTGVPYELALSSSDPGEDRIQGWDINWGDGTVQPVEGNPSSVEHTYTEPLPLPGDFDGDGDVDGIDALRFVLQYRQGNVGGLGDFDTDNDVDNDDLGVFAPEFGSIGWDAYQVSATATDEDGTYTSNTLKVADPPLPEGAGDEQSQTPVHAESSLHGQDSSVGMLAPPSIPQDERIGSSLIGPGATDSMAPAGRMNSAFYSSFNAGIWFNTSPRSGIGWNLSQDVAFGQVLDAWQVKTSALGSEIKTFERKPLSQSSSSGLVDLFAHYDDGELIDVRKAKKTKKAKGEQPAQWVETFLSDFRGMEESRSPNDNIRIALQKKDEAEEK
jgi:RHS repeat-associated protein